MHNKLWKITFIPSLILATVFSASLFFMNSYEEHNVMGFQTVGQYQEREPQQSQLADSVTFPLSSLTNTVTPPFASTDAGREHSEVSSNSRDNAFNPSSSHLSRVDLQKAVTEPIADRYIVVLRNKPATLNVSASNTDEVKTLAKEIRNKGGEIINTYQHALNGYTINVPANNPDLLISIRNDPRIAFIEQDQKMHIFSQTVPSGVQRVGADPSYKNTNVNMDVNMNFNARIPYEVQSNNPVEGNRTVNADVAILDTGIDLTHPDLNVYNQKSFVANTASANDDNGHGTHVAGIAAAKDNNIGVVGVAPGARLWAIKVLDSNGAGSMSDIIAGIDYVTAHANEIDVVNMSFGCECNSSALDAAVNSAVSAGVTFVAAAGNEGKDASTFSPASNPQVLAISAIADSDGKCGGLGQATEYGNDDSFATFSNYGPKVAIAAPGVNILSTYKDNSYATLSGTSMSAPHVTGAAALYKASHPQASPSEVRNVIINGASEPSTICDSDGHGYFTGEPDNNHEPLLYVKSLGK